MTDVSLAIQDAAVAALKASSVTTIVGNRIYDVPPATSAGATATFPYVSLGEGQSIPQRADCLDGTEHYFTVHAWSRAPGYPEVKRIAEAIRATLHDADIPVRGYRLIDLALQSAEFMRDPDGLTSHAALSFRALVDPVD